MSEQVQGALIAATVGILTALLASYLTWGVERRKWLIGLKANVQVELIKTRLVSYPNVMRPLELLSRDKRTEVSQETIRAATRNLNRWLYDAGGLVAEASTRASIVHLRNIMNGCADSGGLPNDIILWRDRVLVLLRRDIDLGSPQVLANPDEALLGQVRREADRLLKPAQTNREA